MNPRTVRLGLVSAGLLAISAVSLTNLASSALFTSTQSTSASVVSSGSVDLSVDGSASTTLAVSSMAPGDARYGIVSVDNTGSLQSRYSGKATWSTGNALTSALTLSVRTIASAVAACDATLSWGTADVVTNASGSGNATTVALFGSAATGQQAGDRTLGAATTEYLCIRMALPTSAGNSVSSLTSNLALTFDAEQTTNNA